MNCREFRRKHDAYIDDTLSGVELEGMARHCRFCEPCSQLDTRVRRALLVARNIPRIQLSPTFGKKLQERLMVERASIHPVMRIKVAAVRESSRPLSIGAFSVITAGVLAVAGLAGVFTLSGSDEAIRLAPVVASRPEPEPSAYSAPTMIAAMPAGMPLWPAVFVAQQAPWHFASDAAGR